MPFVRTSKNIRFCDGTNDNVEIQEALDEVPRGRVYLYPSAATFNLAAGLTINSFNNLCGEVGRWAGPWLKLNNSINPLAIIYSPTTSGSWSVRDISINGNSVNNTISGHGIFATLTASWGSSKCYIQNVGMYQIPQTGIYFYYQAGVQIEQVDIRNCGLYGIHLKSTDNMLTNLLIANCVRNGLFVEADHNKVIQGHIWSNGEESTSNDYKYDVRVTKNDNWFEALMLESSDRGGFYINGGDRNIVTGCNMWNHGKTTDPTIDGYGVCLYNNAVGNVIVGNVINKYSSGATLDYAFKVGSDCSLNVIMSNDLSGAVGFGDFSVDVIKLNTVRYNTKYLTENRGTANLADGEWFSHGLLTIPTYVSLISKGTLVSMGYDATNNSIQILHSGVGSINFAWEAIV